MENRKYGIRYGNRFEIVIVNWRCFEGVIDNNCFIKILLWLFFECKIFFFNFKYYFLLDMYFVLKCFFEVI